MKESIKIKNPFLTRKQVSQILSINLSTVDDYRKKGLIKHYKIGGIIRFKKNEVEESLTQVLI